MIFGWLQCLHQHGCVVDAKVVPIIDDDDDEWSDIQPLLSKEPHRVQSDVEGIRSVTSAAARGDMLPLGQFALMITGIAQARSSPDLLLVESPNMLNDCAACYTLQANTHANGQPFWKHVRRDYWLFSTPMGRWSIAGKDVRDGGFLRSSGWIYQELCHWGLMPDQSSSRWQLFDGKGGFTSDEAFKVHLGGSCVQAPNIFGEILQK